MEPICTLGGWKARAIFKNYSYYSLTGELSCENLRSEMKTPSGKKNLKTRFVAFAVSQSEYLKIEKAASKEDRSISYLLRKIVNAALT